jgi:hypothetical protein
MLRHCMNKSLPPRSEVHRVRRRRTWTGQGSRQRGVFYDRFVHHLGVFEKLIKAGNARLGHTIPGTALTLGQVLNPASGQGSEHGSSLSSGVIDYPPAYPRALRANKRWRTKWHAPKDRSRSEGVIVYPIILSCGRALMSKVVSRVSGRSKMYHVSDMGS